MVFYLTHRQLLYVLLSVRFSDAIKCHTTNLTGITSAQVYFNPVTDKTDVCETSKDGSCYTSWKENKGVYTYSQRCSDNHCSGAITDKAPADWYCCGKDFGDFCNSKDKTEWHPTSTPLPITLAPTNTNGKCYLSGPSWKHPDEESYETCEPDENNYCIIFQEVIFASAGIVTEQFCGDGLESHDMPKCDPENLEKPIILHRRGHSTIRVCSKNKFGNAFLPTMPKTNFSSISKTVSCSYNLEMETKIVYCQSSQICVSVWSNPMSATPETRGCFNQDLFEIFCNSTLDQLYFPGVSQYGTKTDFGWKFPSVEDAGYLCCDTEYCNEHKSVGGLTFAPTTHPHEITTNGKDSDKDTDSAAFTPGPDDDSAIFASVSGCAFFVLLCVILVYLCKRRRQKLRNSIVEPGNFITMPVFLKNALDKIAQDDAELILFFRKNLYTQPSNLLLGNRLGQGEFGEVFAGQYNVFGQEALNNPSVRTDQYKGQDQRTYLPVAVKKLKKFNTEIDRFSQHCLTDQTLEEMRGFLKEGQMLMQFNHPNLVRTYGYIVVRRECYGGARSTWSGLNYPAVMMELLVSLKRYINDNLRQMTIPRKLTWALQIADGMDYLHSHRILHRDLALRNLLIQPELDLVKITDFGLARQINYYYIGNKKGQLPVKWMSPEAITQQVFTPQSDVWSFGVAIWEIITNGCSPFGECSNQQALDLIPAGMKPGIKGNIPDDLYGILLLTWAFQPHDRPTFGDLLDILRTRTNGVTASGAHYLQVTDPYTNRMPAPDSDVVQPNAYSAGPTTPTREAQPTIWTTPAKRMPLQSSTSVESARTHNRNSYEMPNVAPPPLPIYRNLDEPFNTPHLHMH